MSFPRSLVWCGPWMMILAVVIFTAGCEDGERPAPKPEPKPVEGKKVKVGDGITLEVLPKTRRVLIEAEVCLREGPLEQLLTRKGKKEHEAILTADVDARKVHEALLLANAKEGTVVQWVPKYKAPTGTPIKVSLVYKQKGKEVTVDARSWIKDQVSNKALPTDWVFAGSMLVENPFDKKLPKYYLANEGDVICISNFESAMLDIPMQSSKTDADRGFAAWTERIPPVGTKVTVILEPMSEKK